MNVLLTGGLGYIGSNLAAALATGGAQVVIYDNLSNCTAGIADTIAEACGQKPVLIVDDIRNQASLESALKQNSIDAVCHLAALKSVPDSVGQPLDYYDNNVLGTLALVQAMLNTDTKTLIFSSSAAVYGNSDQTPFLEDGPLLPSSPYGFSKQFCEQVLRDAVHAHPDRLQCISLRFFNPAGCHKSGYLGPIPGSQASLMQAITAAATGQLACLKIAGTDYPTSDGTAIRDYIHVSDIAAAHLQALQACSKGGLAAYETLNLGSGVGYSVRQMIDAFEDANDLQLPVEEAQRRPGDPATSLADITKAKTLLGWQPLSTLADMCYDSLRAVQKEG